MLTHILKQLIVDFSCFFILASIRVSKPNLIDNCDFISCIKETFYTLQVKAGHSQLNCLH